MSVAWVLGLMLAAALPAQAAPCPPPTSVTILKLPGRPFSALPTADGCTVLVSLAVSRGKSAIAVLRDHGGAFALDYLYPIDGGAFGAALSPDGSLLFVTSGNTTAVLGVASLEQRAANPLLGRLRDGNGAGAVYALVSPDGRFLFVSDERLKRISVFNVAKARANDFQGHALVGYIPVGVTPVGLALSPNGKWLYSTSERALAGSGLARSCVTRGRRHMPGFLARISVPLAETYPQRAVQRIVQAGCNPVRVVMSHTGRALWVTARGSDALLRIPVNAFAPNGSSPKIMTWRIGSEPVGVAVRPDGQQVWVTLSNRYGKTDYDPAARQLVGLAGLGGTGDRPTKTFSAPASGFPRELSFLPDGKTLVVTLYGAERIEFVPTPP